MEEYKLGDEVSYKVVESQTTKQGTIVNINENLVELKVGNGFIILDKTNIYK